MQVISVFVVAAEEIIAGDDIYGGSDRLLSRVAPKSGVVVKLVSFSSKQFILID